ncbi:MAG: SCP2 sterol-binding domain-containing protein, partial [Candidatus Thorarchaeota archaeon]
MRRRTKGLLAILIIVAIAIPTALYILNGIINPPPPEPLNLDEAPAEIRAIKAELKDKLSEGTFTWDDMENFSTFSNYVAAHHPEAISITKDWEITATLEIIDTGYLWFEVENDALNLSVHSVPPAYPDVTIILTFDTLTEVFSAQTTAAAAFQRGDVDFDGTLGIALKIDRLNTIFSYTIMDEKLYYSSGIIDFVIT